MERQPCSVTDCLFIAWHSCEQCHRPFCDVNARWHTRVVWGRWTTFDYLCSSCLPGAARAANETDKTDRHESASGQ